MLQRLQFQEARRNKISNYASLLRCSFQQFIASIWYMFFKLHLLFQSNTQSNHLMLLRILQWGQSYQDASHQYFSFSVLASFYKTISTKYNKILKFTGIDGSHAEPKLTALSYLTWLFISWYMQVLIMWMKSVQYVCEVVRV